MAIKKSKELKSAATVSDFIKMHNAARDFIRSHLAIYIGELKPADQTRLRNKIAPGKPAKFLAEFDGTKFCFVVAFGSEKHIIAFVEITKLPDAAEAKARAQLAKFGLT